MTKVSFSAPPYTPSCFEASAQLEKLRHGKKNQDLDFEEEKVFKQEHRHEGRKHSYPSGTSFMSPLSSSPPSDAELFLTRVSRETKIHKRKLIEPEIPVLQTVEKNYATASDSRTYRQANKSRKYEEYVPSYIAKLIKKVQSQMKAHFFDSKDSISIVGFLDTFKLPCDANRIQEGA